MPVVALLIRRVDEALASGQVEAALGLARQAQALADDDLGVRQRLGRALLAAHRAAEAVPELAAVARAAPLAAPRLELAEALEMAGDPEGARDALGAALDADPAMPVAHARLIRLLLGQGAAEEAVDAARRARRHSPHAVAIRAEAGRACRVLAGQWRAHGRLAEAEALLRENLGQDSEDGATWADLGVVLRAQGRVDEAVAAYGRALERGETATLHGNLGNALTLLGRVQEAEAHLRRAAALAPGDYLPAYNLAAFLTDQGRPDEALPLFDHALTLRPGDPDALTNKGVALMALGRGREAIATYRAALEARPDSPETHYDLAWALLLDGDLDEGWREYEWRWRLPRFSSPRRALAAPAWDGKPLEGTLLLHAEQGLGDVVWMLRFAAWARSRCGRLVLLCPPPLAALAATAPGIDAVVPDDGAAPPPPFDAHLPMMSLPRLAGSAEGRHSAPYLSATPVRLQGDGPHVGLVWAGNPDNKLDRARSIPLPLLRPLLEVPGVTLHNLQVGPGRAGLADAPDLAARMVDHGAALTNFAATAERLAALDLLVCVDTATAHVAGALGRPGLVLLPLSPGLPWRLRGESSPWYPSLRLIRQTTRGDWGPVIAQAAAAVRALAAGTPR